MRTRDILSKHHQQNELASHDIIVRLTLRDKEKGITHIANPLDPKF